MMNSRRLDSGWTSRRVSNLARSGPCFSETPNWAHGPVIHFSTRLHRPRRLRLEPGFVRVRGLQGTAERKWWQGFASQPALRYSKRVEVVQASRRSPSGRFEWVLMASRSAVQVFDRGFRVSRTNRSQPPQTQATATKAPWAYGSLRESGV